MKGRLKRLEELLVNPFDPEKAIEEFQALLEEVQKFKREELIELENELPKLKSLIERNFNIALGWLEELFKKVRFERKA